MDKTLKYFVFGLVIFILSCSSTGKRFSPAHNIAIKFNHWFTFDYDSKVLSIKFDGEDELRDTLHFNQQEIELIEESFFENAIGDIKGQVDLGHFNEFPSAPYIIDILEDNKLKSSIHWESNYRKGKGSNEKRYVEFCVMLLDILEKKKEFSKMSEISLEKREKQLKSLYDSKK